MSNQIKTVEMQVVGVNPAQPRFTFDMQSRLNEARTVRFSLDQVDAKALYEALGTYLQAK